ncbi:MAG: hypothetical protein ACRCYU_06790, partial [Nocardioides sp.]
SVAGALIITEVILKPVYTKDVLEAAGLNAQVQSLGLGSVQRFSANDWGRLLTATSNLAVIVPHPGEFRGAVWPHILREAQRSTCRVTAYFDTSSDPDIAYFEESWRDRVERLGASSLALLEVTPLPFSLLVLTDRYVGLTVATNVQKVDPMMFVFDRSMQGDVSGEISDAFAKLEKSTSDSPIWSSPNYKVMNDGT